MSSFERFSPFFDSSSPRQVASSERGTNDDRRAAYGRHDARSSTHSQNSAAASVRPKQRNNVVPNEGNDDAYNAGYTQRQQPELQQYSHADPRRPRKLSHDECDPFAQDDRQQHQRVTSQRQQPTSTAGAPRGMTSRTTTAAAQPVKYTYDSSMARSRPRPGKRSTGSSSSIGASSESLDAAQEKPSDASTANPHEYAANQW